MGKKFKAIDQILSEILITSLIRTFKMIRNNYYRSRTDRLKTIIIPYELHIVTVLTDTLSSFPGPDKKLII